MGNDESCGVRKLGDRPSEMGRLAEVFRLVFLLLTLLATPVSWAQSEVYVPQFVFSPSLPQPGDAVSVFIRVTDPINGTVRCPEAFTVITGVSRVGTNIVLDLNPIRTPGGVNVPYCDGNIVSLGSLPQGTYTITARSVLGGVPGPTAITGSLVVGAAALDPVGVPTMSPQMAILMALLLGVSGMYAARIRKRRS